MSEVVARDQRQRGHGDQNHLQLRHPGGKCASRHAHDTERGSQQRGRSKDPQEPGCRREATRPANLVLGHHDNLLSREWWSTDPLQESRVAG
jgi:hypothetical protein